MGGEGGERDWRLKDRTGRRGVKLGDTREIRDGKRGEGGERLEIEM